MNSARPSVGVIVVNWNGEAQTRDCVASLNALSYPNVEVCVIDGGSTDGSAERFINDPPGAHFIALPANLGFAAACNVGLAWARDAGHDYTWILNNDTTVHQESLSELVGCAQQLDRTAIVAPQILTTNDPPRVWSAGGTYRWPWKQAEHLHQDETPLDGVQPIRVAWASGCSLLVPLRMLETIGPMDERYFLYLEDVEWCARAERLGVEVWVQPTALINHSVSQTVSAIDPRIPRYYGVRNYYLFASRYCSPVGKAFLAGRFAITCAKIAARSLLYPSYRSDGWYQAQTRALYDFTRRRFGKAPYAEQFQPSTGTSVPQRAVS